MQSLPRLGLALSVAISVVVVAGCTDTTYGPVESRGASSGVSSVTTASTTTSSTTSTSTVPASTEQAAADALTACQTWAFGPSSDQQTRNATQTAAAAQAGTAAAHDPRWQRLLDAMKEVNALPETDVSPDQEATAETDLTTIHSECAVAGVTVP